MIHLNAGIKQTTPHRPFSVISKLRADVFFQENAWSFRRTTMKHIPLISNFLTHVAMESSYAVRRWTLVCA